MTDLPTEKLNRCPECQSKNTIFWCQGIDRLHELNHQEYIYSRCQDCNLIFQSLRPLEADIWKFYPENYQPYQNKENSQNINLSEDKISHEEPFFTILQKIITKNWISLRAELTNPSNDDLNKQLQKFYQPSKAGLTLLDFGCGSEVFLNQVRERGWNTIGIDFSPQSVEQVSAHGHQAFLMSPQVWDEIEDESLDCVRINHVLEHLYHPQENLQAIYAKMKPGGMLHIGTPNPYSITSQIFRSRWFSLDCPRHIILYSPALLKKVLTATGFSEVRILHETITKDFLRSCGYFLYDLGLINHDELAKIGKRRYLRASLYPFAKLVSALGAADRFHVFCIK